MGKRPTSRQRILRQLGRVPSRSNTSRGKVPTTNQQPNKTQDQHAGLHKQSKEDTITLQEALKIAEDAVRNMVIQERIDKLSEGVGLSRSEEMSSCSISNIIYPVKGIDK